MLLENPATYLLFAQSTIPEAEFLAEISRRTGCGLLLDINNVFVASTNHQIDPRSYLDAFPLAQVQEIHLGGHSATIDETGAALMIDTHDKAVADPVWSLFMQAVARPAASQRSSSGMTRCRHGQYCSPRPDGPSNPRSPRRSRSHMMSGMIATYQARFAEALLGPKEAVPDGLVSWSGAPPLRRFEIYRNNVTRGLVQALAIRFPATETIVGTRFFSAMAREYVLAHPPNSPVLLDYGKEFEDFVRSFAPAAGCGICRI